MNKIQILATSLVALTLGQAALADVTINISGSSAFRTATSIAILNTLSGETYAYDGTSFTSATYQIFKGTYPGLGNVTVRTRWTGSVEGIRDVAGRLNIGFLPTTQATSSTGTSGASTTGLDTTTPPDVALADNTQASTSFRNPALTPITVGIVPFAFVAGQNTPAAITNITTQLANGLLQNGSLPTSQFTNGTDATPIYLVGRDNLSGTRLTTLAETGFGVRRPVVQYLATASTTAGATNTIATLGLTGSNGNGGVSGSTLVSYLRYGSNSVAVSGAPASPVGLIGYLGESDSYSAVYGLGSSTIQGNGAGNARYLSYNGISAYGGVAKRPNSATTTVGSKVVTLPNSGAANDVSGLVVGQIVSGNGIEAGSVITAVGTNTITLDKNATATGNATTGNATFQIGALLPAAIRNGTYTFWNYEYLMYRSDILADKRTFADALAQQIITRDYSYSGLGDDTALKVFRENDGTAPLPNGN